MVQIDRYQYNRRRRYRRTSFLARFSLSADRLPSGGKDQPWPIGTAGKVASDSPRFLIYQIARTVHVQQVIGRRAFLV
jgi:hypothetical protein